MKRILLSFVFLVSATAIANQTVRTTSEGSVKLSIDVPSASGQPSSMIDVLFVVDDSGSMYDHQTQVADRLPLLVDKMAKMGVDFHVGVITSTVGVRGNKTGDGVLFDGFASSQMPDFAKKVASAIKVGNNGSGEEKFFAPLKMALTEPLLSGANAGFLRSQAPLAVVFVTDGEDMSTETPEEMVTFLTTLKGGAGFRTMAAFIPSIDTACMRSGELQPVRIEAFLAATSGTSATLCDPGMSDTLAGAIASMITPSGPNPMPAPIYDRSIELPSKATLSSIVVRYDNQTLLFGDAWAGWVFDSNKNAVIIGDGVVLGAKPWMTKIEIEYQIAGWP